MQLIYFLIPYLKSKLQFEFHIVRYSFIHVWSNKCQMLMMDEWREACHLMWLVLTTRYWQITFEVTLNNPSSTFGIAFDDKGDLLLNKHKTSPWRSKDTTVHPDKYMISFSGKADSVVYDVPLFTDGFTFEDSGSVLTLYVFSCFIYNDHWFYLTMAQFWSSNDAHRLVHNRNFMLCNVKLFVK